MIRRTALGFAALTLGLPLATPVRALGPVASIEQERAEGSEPLFVFTTRLTEFSPLGEIRFESKARVLSCCLKYVPDVELRGRVLRIFERDEGPACDCEDVPWDLQAILVDVDPGDYEVYLHDAKGTLLATALVTVPTTMTQAFVRGRVNDDDKTNVADAVALVEHLFRGKRGPACPDAADVTDDGK
ncbi:MAG: hypothetical protein HY721_29510, partial [Planctomycetes bacterium]|nr:hypothetical protein [Planctomycetota bacterium]